jgi:hypothetical protein
MTVAVLVVAGVAGFISYSHAVAVALRYGGEGKVAAHLLPVSLDGMVFASALTSLWCSRYQVPQPRLARFALWLGIGATLAVNVLHGVSYGPLAAVIAAWPAIALVVSFELSVWIVAASRALDTRSVVVVEQKDSRTDQLSTVAQMIANDRSVTAKRVAVDLGISYSKACSVTREARELLATVQ